MKKRLFLLVVLLAAMLAACQPESEAPTPTLADPATVPAEPTDPPATDMPVPTDTPAGYPAEPPVPTETPAPYPDDTPSPTEVPGEYPGGEATVPAGSATPAPTMEAPGNVDIEGDVDQLTLEQGTVALGWSDGETCQIIALGPLLGQEEVAVGPCRSQFSFYDFAPETPFAEEDLAYFVERYASFSAWTAAGYVRLLGEGDQVATPDEQRTIATWVRYVASSATRTDEVPSPPLAYYWQVEGGIAGFCHTLMIYRTGVVEAFDECDGVPQGDPAEHGYLTAEEVALILEWVDTYQNETFQQTDDAVADTMTVTVQFTGSGDRPLNQGVQQQMRDTAGEIYNRLTQ